MSSALKPTDKERLLRGITKRVGNKPYENGNWGENSVKDRVLIELYDSGGNFIEFQDLSIADSFAETEGVFIKLKPAKNLKENFGFETGTFQIRYRFLRELAGREKPVLLRTKAGFEDEIYVLNEDASNIHIDNTGKIFKGTTEQFNANPEIAETLLITDYKYIIDAVSNTRTEVRLRAKNIEDSFLGGGSGHQYISDFQKLQESTRVEDVDQNISFVEVFQDPSTITGFSAGSGPPPTNFNTSKDLEVVTQPGGFVFTNNMIGGTITLPNAFLMGFQTERVRTDLNIIANDTFEDVEVDVNTGQPALIEAPWDSSLHSDAVKLENWTSGFNGLTGTVHDGSAGIGYHAKFVRNEGTQGGICLKFIDQNNVFVDYESWPVTDAHRELSVKQEVLELQSLGAGIGDDINISFDMKSTLVGKGVSMELIYPLGIFNEPKPINPPDGYFDPFNPQEPTEPIPTSPPNGYLSNTSGNASTVEPAPPSRQVQILSEYDIPVFFGEVGDTTATTEIGGEGVWIITSRTPGLSPTYQWGPNLGVEYTKAGELSPGGEWSWDGAGSWNPNVPGSAPNVPVGTVSPDDYNNAANAHPYQFPGQGTPEFQRNNTPGENAGWQTGTIVGRTKIMLIKDDLIWILEQSFTANSDDVEVFRFDDYFPAVRNFVFEDTGKTLYDDMFENGKIQSITRTRKTNDQGIRSDFYIVFYTNGSGEDDCNRAFMVERGATEIGGGGVDDGLKFWKDLDGDFNNILNENGGEFETLFRKKDNKFLHYFAIKGSNQYWRMGDGDGEFFEEGSGGTFFDEDYPAVFDGSQDNKGFAGLPSEWDVAFSKDAYSGHWSVWSCIIGDTYYKMKSDAGDDGVDSSKGLSSFAFGAGEVNTGGVDLIFGPRNPAADNYNPDAVYDDGTAIFSFDQDPKKDGTLSPANQWRWDGDAAQWNSLEGAPVYSYNSIVEPYYATTAGGWGSYETSITIPEDWNPVAPWFLKINGHNVWDNTLTPATAFGVTWVDNIFVDFTLNSQETQVPLYKPFTAQIRNIYQNGTRATLNRSYEEAANALKTEDGQQDFVEGDQVVEYPSFQISYLIYNPYDLRTYLKFGNQTFLTTNFKKDVTSNPFPYSVTYKLYEPLPSNISPLSECTVVKEMADPLIENVEIVDFIDTEVGDVVLRDPDLMNVESPIQVRTTDYKTEDDILTKDAFISNELQNEFLSQSLDSVELNIDFTKFENFINFSSAEKRISNFQSKVSQIESFKITSASYIGISGSESDMNFYHNQIKDIKNNFDPFENYMYFKSSSYVTSSLGEFYDNAWPKSGGSGTVTDPYVLAHTTSSQAIDWFNEQITSASLYDLENFNKLSNIIPLHIKNDTSNATYLTLVDMIGHHFDNVWVYIKGLTDTFDRREKLTEGISRDLLKSVGQSLGWELNDGKDLISLSKYALGKEVTGSAYNDYSTTSERDVSREIWSRIINNMPFFLKNKGSVRAIKGLISAYGIPSTILRVKEYGGPDLPDDATPQFEIARKFTRALDFRNSQFVKTIWTTDDSSNRIPDTIEFRFRAATGSNQILVEKEPNSPNVSSSFYIRLKDNDSVDNFGHVAFQLSGSDGLKEISSSNFPVYDGDFYSVMVRRMSGSDSTLGISQSIELHVGHYDAGRSKIDKFSTSVMDLNVAASSSYIGAYATPGEIYIGGKADDPLVGVQFSGSIMEYRHWTETLNTGSFRNHIGNPKAFDGNTISSSYNNLVLRYSFDDNKDLNTDTDGIRDVSANQTTTYSGSHDGFTGNFFRAITDETKTNIPSIGALRRVTNKIRVEENKLRPGFSLSAERRATISAYDTAPVDSNKVGVFFAPTDVINNDIINSVANLNFDNFLGDPRDRTELHYRGLQNVADNYWQKYTSPNNFWDYIRLLKYYDQSLFPQVRKMIPARAKPTLGILVEPNIFERPKVIIGRNPQVTRPHFSQSIDVDSQVIVTGSYNIGLPISNYEQWTGRVDMFSYETGSSVISASGEFPSFTSSITEFADRQAELSLWQRLKQPGDYSNITMSFGDIHYNEFIQPSISGSRLHLRNQKEMKFFSTPASASVGNAHSSSFFFVDIDNLADERQALFNSYYGGVKNTIKTTQDGGPPVEVAITTPTKLVQKDEGESTLDTGEGVVAKFKPKKGKAGARAKVKRLPSSPDAAVRQEEEALGRPLNQAELEETIKDFRGKKKIRRRKKKVKPKVRGGRIAPSFSPNSGIRIPDPSSKKPKKRGRPRRKKKGRGRGRR